MISICLLRYCVNVYHMNSDDKQDEIDRKRLKLTYGFQVLPRRTTSILMEISNNGKCRAVTSLDDSNIAAPISSDKKVYLLNIFYIYIYLLNVFIFF